MSYLVRFSQGKAHHVAHQTHTIQGITGALCSQLPQPAENSASRAGRWILVEELPPHVRVCHICAKIQHRLDNPIPERVERELALLAKWDPVAAERQRKKMEAHYREQQSRKNSR